MKTSELTGAALDWAVAKCLEKTVFAVEKLDCIVFKDNDWNVFNPSTNPSIGLPIIKANFIDIQFFKNEDWASSMAPHFGHVYKGPTLLIAAMRCYVASKLGNDIEIPGGTAMKTDPMKKYTKVPQLKNGNSCQMCIADDDGQEDVARCNDLPDCTGSIFVRPADLPEYHVRFIADRMENP